MTDIRTLGVIGAGQMGIGIAQVSAEAGYDVILSDIDLPRAEKGKANIAKLLARAVDKEKMTQTDADAVLARITPVGELAPLADAQFVIEAATEREEVKRAIFGNVGKLLGKDAILATNTSSIPITRLAQAAPDAERFIGVHFFNPVPVMVLVEIIRGLATTPEVVEAVEAYATRIGKTAVHAFDAPGFVVNRILLPMLNEAVFVLGEGVGSVTDIDQGCKLGLNHPMGPLTLLDFVGLDTALEILNVFLTTTGDPKYRPRAAAGQICRSRLVWPQDRPRLLRLFRAGTRADPLIRPLR